MASIRDRDAGRDAEHYDDDRKEGRYSPGGDRADWFATACAITLPRDPATGATFCPVCRAPEPERVSEDGCGDCDAALAGVDV